jgi:hypothetical protein
VLSTSKWPLWGSDGGIGGSYLFRNAKPKEAVSPNRRHAATKSAFDGRDERGRVVYRATCTCGWVGESVTADQVVGSWEAHHASIYADLTPTPPDGIDINA